MRVNLFGKYSSFRSRRLEAHDLPADSRERLERRLCVAGECRVWTGSRDAKGYGRFWLDGRNDRAHRVAWMLATGFQVPPDAVIAHSCDNPPCCNPDHLVLCSTEENNLDKQIKRRGRGPTRPRKNPRLCKEA